MSEVKKYIEVKKLRKDGFGLKDKLNKKPYLLKDRFIIPPFSILNTRVGDWQIRKRDWIKLGITGEDGRAETNKIYSQAHEWQTKNKGGDTNKITLPTVSVFDPVLTELMYKWFCVPNGEILDPFAGGSTRGVVAEYLGYSYTGIELRLGQIQANEKQAGNIGVNPNWIHGDSYLINDLLPINKKYDMIFACPPYYDLEVYSEKQEDGSAFETYEKFLVWYKHIFKQCYNRLRNNSFIAVVVGEIRDGDGFYRNFVGDTITTFLDIGLEYYNEIILATAIGSLPIRATKQFIAGRKIGKAHQNILVFYKGDPKKIKTKFNTFEG